MPSHSEEPTQLQFIIVPSTALPALKEVEREACSEAGGKKKNSPSFLKCWPNVVAVKGGVQEQNMGAESRTTRSTMAAVLLVSSTISWYWSPKCKSRGRERRKMHSLEPM